MAVATRGTSYNFLQRAPCPSGLADVLNVILDKGIVIDAFVRISVIGIELVTIDARIVIASVDTYLRFAEAVNRLDIVQNSDAEGLPELMESMTEGGAKSKVKGLAEGAKDAVKGGDDDDDDDGEKSQRRSRSSSRSRSRSKSSS